MQVWVESNEVATMSKLLEKNRIYPCIDSAQKLPIMLLTPIKTHDSESRGQEEAGRTHDEQVSYLTHSTALKLVNALNKPP